MTVTTTNTESLVATMTGKAGAWEAQNSSLYTKTGRIVMCIPKETPFENGRYNSTSMKKVSDDLAIPSLFEERLTCTNSIVIPVRMIVQLCMQLHAWRNASGPQAESVNVVFTDSDIGEHYRIRIVGDGIPEKFGSFSQTFDVKKGGQEERVNFRFSVKELLTWLYPVKTMGNKKECATLFYRIPEEKSSINALPVFIEFGHYDRIVTVGHQVCADVDIKEDDPESFLGTDGQIKPELEHKEPAQDKKPKRAKAARKDFNQS